MIIIRTNNAMEQAKADAIAIVRQENRPYAVVIGFEDGRATWSPVPLTEVGPHEQIAYVVQVHA